MNKPLNVLFLSNMMVEKGVMTAIEAARILKSRGVAAELRFVGKWSDVSADDFASAVRNAHVDDMCFAFGARYGEEKEHFLAAADVFIFPTYYHNECFPIVLLEAMRHSLPCITTGEGGITDIVDDGETGFIVEKHNAEALADKIEYFAVNRAECRRMGKNGCIKFEQHFTLERFERRFCEIIDDCLT